MRTDLLLPRHLASDWPPMDPRYSVLHLQDPSGHFSGQDGSIPCHGGATLKLLAYGP